MSCFTFLMTDSLLNDQTHRHTAALLGAQAWGQDPPPPNSYGSTLQKGLLYRGSAPISAPLLCAWISELMAEEYGRQAQRSPESQGTPTPLPGKPV